MFVGPTQLPELRYLSERSCFVTWKDGGPVLYNRDYAVEWLCRMQVVSRLGRANEDAFRQTARLCGIDYAITLPARRLDLPIVFENEGFIAYDVRQER